MKKTHGISSLDDIKNSALGFSFFPAGVLFAYSGTVSPVGALICDGSIVSRTIYAKLFAIIGTSHGSGDGSTTFHLPDLRGRFLRGVDNGAGRDVEAASRTASNTGGNTGDNIGSAQDDSIQGHQHISTTQPINQTHDFSVTPSTGIRASTYGPSTTVDNAPYTGSPVNDGINGNPRLSPETRVKNININYIITTGI